MTAGASGFTAAMFASCVPGVKKLSVPVFKMLRAHLHHFLTALNFAYADPARPQRAGSVALENYFGRLFGR